MRPLHLLTISLSLILFVESVPDCKKKILFKKITSTQYEARCKSKDKHCNGLKYFKQESNQLQKECILTGNELQTLAESGEVDIFDKLVAIDDNVLIDASRWTTEIVQQFEKVNNYNKIKLKKGNIFSKIKSISSKIKTHDSFEQRKKGIRSKKKI